METYSLAADFGGSINQDQFHQEINDEAGITTTFFGTTITEDVVEVLFESTISSGEKTVLDTLVSNHVPDFSKPRGNFFSVSVNPEVETTNTSYTKMVSFFYNGSMCCGDIDYIDVASYKDGDVTSYDLRVVNSSNSDVIAEATGLTNETLEINDLGTISNIPSNPTILELQGRRTGGLLVDISLHINIVNIYHGN